MAEPVVFGVKIEVGPHSVDWINQQVHPAALLQIQQQVWRHCRGTWEGWAVAGKGLTNVRVAMHATDLHIVVELLGDTDHMVRALLWQEELDLLRFRSNIFQSVNEVLTRFTKREWDSFVMATPTSILHPSHCHW